MLGFNDPGRREGEVGFSGDIVYHGPGPEPLDGRRLYDMVFNAFPEPRADVFDMVVHETTDRPAVRYWFSGTHCGPFGCAEPTGRSVELEGMAFLSFAGGSASTGRSATPTRMTQIGAFGDS